MRIFRSANDPKLEAVLARLCQKKGDLWTTHAVKLPYLVDLVATHVLGRRITNSHHKAWTHGVVTARAWGLIKRADGGDYFKVYGDAYADGARLSLEQIPPALETLSEEELAIIDFVADEFGDLPILELAQLTKDLNPEVEEWGGQRELPLTEDAYQRLPIWYGEDQVDGEIANQRLQELRRNPNTVVSGEDAEDLLASFAGVG